MGGGNSRQKILYYTYIMDLLYITLDYHSLPGMLPVRYRNGKVFLDYR